MDSEFKNLVKEILGNVNGKLYEFITYGGKLSTLLTKEEYFDVFITESPVNFLKDVTDRSDSKIVNEIHKIFGNNIKIIAWCDYFSQLSENNTIFAKYGELNDIICDSDCTYIICTVDNDELIDLNIEPNEIVADDIEIVY